MSRSLGSDGIRRRIIPFLAFSDRELSIANKNKILPYFLNKNIFKHKINCSSQLISIHTEQHTLSLALTSAPWSRYIRAFWRIAEKPWECPFLSRSHRKEFRFDRTFSSKKTFKIKCEKITEKQIFHKKIRKIMSKSLLIY